MDLYKFKATLFYITSSKLAKAILCSRDRTSKMAQGLKVLATEPDNLSSITETYRVKEENQFLKIVLCPAQSISHAIQPLSLPPLVGPGLR